MYIEQSLYTYLIAQSTLTALIADRLYAGTAPQDVESPYVVFFEVSDVPEQSHSGHSKLNKARYQFSIFAETLLECRAIEAVLFTLLNGLNQNLSGLWVTVLMQDSQYLFETELHHLAVDYMINYSEV